MYNLYNNHVSYNQIYSLHYLISFIFKSIFRFIIILLLLISTIYFFSKFNFFFLTKLILFEIFIVTGC